MTQSGALFQNFMRRNIEACVHKIWGSHAIVQSVDLNPQLRDDFAPAFTFLLQ